MNRYYNYIKQQIKKHYLSKTFKLEMYLSMNLMLSSTGAYYTPSNDIFIAKILFLLSAFFSIVLFIASFVENKTFRLISSFLLSIVSLITVYHYFILNKYAGVFYLFNIFITTTYLYSRITLIEDN